MVPSSYDGTDHNDREQGTMTLKKHTYGGDQ